MKQKFFDLIRSTVTVEFLKDEQIKPVFDLIGELETDHREGSKPNYTIALANDVELSKLPQATVFYAGDVAEDGFFEFARNNSHWSVIKPGQISGVFSLDRPEGKIVRMSSCPAGAKFIVNGFALDQAVLLGNQSLIHAAVIESPDGNSRLVIHAASGIGKTTTTLALAAAGYKICSDDVAVVGSGDNNRSDVWGFPRHLKVHKKTAEMLPWLHSFITPEGWNHLDEQIIRRSDLDNVGYLANSAPKTVSTVIALSRSNGKSTSLRQQDRFESLAALSSENIQFNSTGLLPGHEKHFDIYAALIADTTSYELCVSDDMQEIVDAVDDIVKFQR